MGIPRIKLSEGNLSRDVDNQIVEAPSDAYKTIQDDKKVTVYQDTSSISVHHIALASPVFFDRGKILSSGSTIEHQPIPAAGTATPYFSQLHSHNPSIFDKSLGCHSQR